jgi:hypothetical protein
MEEYCIDDAGGIVYVLLHGMQYARLRRGALPVAPARLLRLVQAGCAACTRRQRGWWLRSEALQ